MKDLLSSVPATVLESPDLTIYRNKPTEIDRVADLMRLIPDGLRSAIDIGARDGHISKAIATRISEVTALDLECPKFSHRGVTCVQGDATALQFKERSFDLVFCAEVLEHIPSPALEAACAEMARVANKYVLIGVPYKQDIRQAKTTCYTCGAINPPWGHVNSFDEARLVALFPSMKSVAISFVGVGAPGTNALSSALMTYAGNPFGTYIQEERCIGCGNRLVDPPIRALTQKCATKAAVWLDKVQAVFQKPRGNWIHMLFKA